MVALARYCEFYGNAAALHHGTTIPFLQGYTVMTIKEPHGVCAGIIPWNYPVSLLKRADPASPTLLTVIRDGLGPNLWPHRSRSPRGRKRARVQASGGRMPIHPPPRDSRNPSRVSGRCPEHRHGVRTRSRGLACGASGCRPY
jgi:hypothetical protein